MNNLLKIVVFAVACAFSVHEGSGQSEVLDGAYHSDNFMKRVIPYPHLREADVMYKKRVWQIIDLDQKFNQPFLYPLDPIENRKNLYDVIKMGLLEGQITAYSPGADKQDDEFTTSLTAAGLDTVLFEKVTNPVYSPSGEVIGERVDINPIESDIIRRYQIKEEWIWDKQRSERYVRIIGIAPMVMSYNNSGEPNGFAPLFWLYYPHCRNWFASEEAEVYNIFNDAQRRTFEDLFQKRYFSSYIVKEDNAFNRPVIEYAKGLAGLVESERIQQELFNLEHDLWHY